MEKYIDKAKEIIEWGNYEAAVNLMDDEIREELHRENITYAAQRNDIEFIAEYMLRHYEKYGEEFTI